jgi:ketosteroid isomerase-like protein
MLTPEHARRFAEDWIAAWNAHDLQRILSHYTDEFEMRSPYIRELAGEPSGILQGKAAVGAYWSNALAKFPDLNFELIEVLTGADSVAVSYFGRGRRRACEVFFFDDKGRVARSVAHYGE